MIDEFKDKSIVENEDLNNILVSFINRARFHYSPKKIMAYLLQCLCMRNLKNSRNLQKVKNHFLY